MNPATNGGGLRKCTSWIERYVEYSDNLGSAEIWRRWAAISTIAATLEQKVWLETASPLYPNLFVIVIGAPGTGKTRAIMSASRIAREIPEIYFSPTSMTMASLVDALSAAKRTLVRLPDPAVEYNSLYIVADELGAFLHEYDDQLISGLTKFYDVEPYGQKRRTRDVDIKILRPQLNLLCGATPAALMKLVPEYAWEQGFMSRTIMVYSNNSPEVDDFGQVKRKSDDLLHDLKIIRALDGPFVVTDEYRKAVTNWRALKETPRPIHPKLIHYCSRRRSNLYKLSMISSVDRTNNLHLTVEDFNRAMNWLVDAEQYMPEVFQAGTLGADAKAMDEILHFVTMACIKTGSVPERLVVKFTATKVPNYSVLRVIDLMERSGMIKAVSYDPKLGVRMFAPGDHI